MITRLARALIRGYQDAREELRTVGRALPGVQDVLASLAHSAVVHQSVVTGNLRDVARIKLEAFDLDHYFDLDAGAYGDDDHERPKLVAIVQRRATERTGVMLDNDATVLIGDTPQDVDAGLASGVRMIGVATGKTSIQELRNVGAHHVATNLAECHVILNRLIVGKSLGSASLIQAWNIAPQRTRIDLMNLRGGVSRRGGISERPIRWRSR